MSILDQVKNVAKLAQEYGRIELYQKAVDLQSQVNDLAAENTELRQVVAEARQQVADLQEKLRLKGQVVFRHGVYFLNEEDGAEEGPFLHPLLGRRTLSHPR